MNMQDPAVPIIKEKADDAFNKNDFIVALSLYSYLSDIYPQNGIYHLNQSLTFLRLQRHVHPSFLGTHLTAFLLNGGSSKTAQAEAERLEVASAAASGNLERDSIADLGGLLSQTLNLKSNCDTDVVYEFRASGNNGLGAFALKPLRRGDIILTETPLVPIDDPIPNKIISAFRKLSPRDISRCLLLQNAHPNDGIFWGIYKTNAFAQAGIVFEASRFNHSCSPNAHYTYHEPSKRQRIIVLTDITAGEEIFVSYIRGRNVYGSPRSQRRQMLMSRYRFCCMCLACDEANYQASDRRRQEIGSIWEALPRSVDGRQALTSVVKAVTLMKAEGYYADADDFAVDAAALCAGHSDWISCVYWARFSYETRAIEYGADHPHTERAREILAQPRSKKYHPQAGVFPKKTFRNIRLPH
ncbi:hypothetical protein BDP27DRAFT_1421935 [Rhodocollybia butyracea]|uniref:SET domain-containing protein n=1 Tax=Rhodocollybia butyracea TaxID=206335 RepID=A0A9P5U6W2_9AGAR|nr:hypothetical protein BDP27DRAFT_1421935 [Rhodocollybia butyracea]